MHQNVCSIPHWRLTGELKYDDDIKRNIHNQQGERKNTIWTKRIVWQRTKWNSFQIYIVHNEWYVICIQYMFNIIITCCIRSRLKEKSPKQTNLQIAEKYARCQCSWYVFPFICIDVLMSFLLCTRQYLIPFLCPLICLWDATWYSKQWWCCSCTGYRWHTIYCVRCKFEVNSILFSVILFSSFSSCSFFLFVDCVWFLLMSSS